MVYFLNVSLTWYLRLAYFPCVVPNLQSTVVWFITLHIAAQSGRNILLVLIVSLLICHSHWSSEGGINVCVCVCVCVFIKLHITTQSGPVILVILYHSH